MGRLLADYCQTLQSEVEEVKKINKDQAIGFFIFIGCFAVAAIYSIGLFWPPFEAYRLWIVAVPVFIGFMVVMAIGVWIGWIMVLTPPPKPIEVITDIGERESLD